MNLLSYFTGNIDKVVNSVDSLIDNTFTSDEERLNAKNKLAKIKHDAKIEAKKLSNDYEQNITKRWLSDNKNLLTSLVRPLIVIFLYVLFGAVVLSDGNIGDFKIYADYIPVLQNLLFTVTVAYFGSRGLEKMKGVA